MLTITYNEELNLRLYYLYKLSIQLELQIISVGISSCILFVWVRDAMDKLAIELGGDINFQVVFRINAIKRLTIMITPNWIQNIIPSNTSTTIFHVMLAAPECSFWSVVSHLWHPLRGEILLFGAVAVSSRFPSELFCLTGLQRHKTRTKDCR